VSRIGVGGRKTCSRMGGTFHAGAQRDCFPEAWSRNGNACRGVTSDEKVHPFAETVASQKKKGHVCRSERQEGKSSRSGMSQDTITVRRSSLGKLKKGEGGRGRSNGTIQGRVGISSGYITYRSTSREVQRGQRFNEKNEASILRIETDR